MTPSREAREEIRRYVRSRDARKPKWTATDIEDAVVALALAILFVWMVVT